MRTVIIQFIYKGSPSGLLFVFPKPTNEGGEEHGQSAGQENRAGKRNVPARAEIG